LFLAPFFSFYDVEKVTFPSYGSQTKGLLDGSLDWIILTANGAIAYEIEAKKGLVWLQLPKDPAGVSRVVEVCPFYVPGSVTEGAGCSEENPQWICNGPVCVSAYADADTYLIYRISKAIWEGYDEFKGTVAGVDYYSHENLVAFKKQCIPYHDGVVRMLKEQGAWTPEMDKWQKLMVEKEQARRAAWVNVRNEAIAAQVDFKSEEWTHYRTGTWRKYLDEHDLLVYPEL